MKPFTLSQLGSYTNDCSGNLKHLMISTLIEEWVFFVGLFGRFLWFVLCFLLSLCSLFGNQSAQQVLSFRTTVINLITSAYQTQSQMRNRLSSYWGKNNVLFKTYDEK